MFELNCGTSSCGTSSILTFISAATAFSQKTKRLLAWAQQYHVVLFSKYYCKFLRRIVWSAARFLHRCICSFGTTHFCAACHDDFQRLICLPKHLLPKCPVGPRGIQIDGDECPLRIQHPPTGEEFPLGCGICRNINTF